MSNLNMPIYRAKKIDSDEYVEGFYKNVLYFKDKHIITSLVNISGVENNIQKTNLWDYKNYEIDHSTLAIHFPNMLDSQGNKIFASLNEDGKGGDIVKHEQLLGGILKSVGPEECIIKYCNRDHIVAPFFINAKYKNQKTYMTKEHLLIIGIQK